MNGRLSGFGRTKCLRKTGYPNNVRGVSNCCLRELLLSVYFSSILHPVPLHRPPLSLRLAFVLTSLPQLINRPLSFPLPDLSLDIQDFESQKQCGQILASCQVEMVARTSVCFRLKTFPHICVLIRWCSEEICVKNSTVRSYTSCGHFNIRCYTLFWHFHTGCCALYWHAI